MDAGNATLAAPPVGGIGLRRSGAVTGAAPSKGRLLVVDEHPLIATGLQLALSERHWDVERSCGPTATDVVDQARRFEPGCVLLDVRLGDDIGSGIDLIAPLTATGAEVVMLTSERRRPILAGCLEAGAAGFISKSEALDVVDTSLCHLLSGETLIGRSVRAALLDELRREREREMRAHARFESLTPREALVLAALADGLGADQIARDHVVSVATVRTQIRAVLQKLNVRSQLAAVAVAHAHSELLPDRGGVRRDRRQADRRRPGGAEVASVRT